MPAEFTQVAIAVTIVATIVLLALPWVEFGN